MQRIEIECVIRGALLRLYPMRDGKARTVLVQLPANPLYVRADPQRLLNAIVEMIEDSAERSACGARILVSIEHEREETVIRIRESLSRRERILHLVPASAPLAAGPTEPRAGIPSDR